MSFSIGIGPNIRKSPYFDATVADGVQSFSVYNHMYLDGGAVSAAAQPLPVLQAGERVGSLNEMAHSHRLGCNIATGLLASDMVASAQDLEVILPDGPRRIEVAALPFIR